MSEPSAAQRPSAVAGWAFAAFLLSFALVLAVGGGSAQAAPKGVLDVIGTSGSQGRQFTTPRGVAVRESTGEIYVVDSANQRIQKFDQMGTFLRAWGKGVAGGTGAEICVVELMCVAGTSGTLGGEFNTPHGIAIDQDDGSVYVTEQINLRVQKFNSEGIFQLAFGRDVVPGAPTTTEVCNAAASCKSGTGGSAGGEFNNAVSFTGHPAVDPTSHNVIVADPGNRRVQEFTSGGVFVRTWGWDVQTGGVTTFEVCTVAASCKVAATSGSDPGRFATNQPNRVAVDSLGFVYAVESTVNFRVQKFNPSLTSRGVFAPAHLSGGVTSPGSAAVGPTDVAVDTADDRVFVTKPTGSPVERRVLELDLNGNLLDTHAAGAGLPATNGLALRRSSGRLYLPSGTATTTGRVFVLGAVTPPSATIAPVTDVTATTATFHGTVNPNNDPLPTGYHYEYSDDAGFSWTTVPGDDDIGNGTTDHDTTLPVTGLEPNTPYRVRLVATKPFASARTVSQETTFSTLPAPPSISEVEAREVTDTTAVLGGRIDPNRTQTTYRFEYGTDTSYGSSTPVDSAGAGPRGVPVSKAITGLQPGTTYHFRLVATSAAGETGGPDLTFATDAVPPPPKARAYEMVSPLDKNGGDILRDDTNAFFDYQTGVAVAGDAVAFISRVGFGDLEGVQVQLPNYMARRGNAGWTTQGITAPLGTRLVLESSPVMGLSPDLSKAFVVTGASLTPDAATLNGTYGLYMRSSDEAQRYRLLSIRQGNLVPNDPDTQETFFPNRFEYEGSTPDSRHVVFSSSRRLLQDAPADQVGGSNAVYEWVDGSVRLASVLPQELSLTSEPFVTAGGNAGQRLTSGQLHGDNLMSDDGRRLFFSATTNGGAPHLFVRQDGTTTRLLSRSQLPGDPFASGAARFWAAKNSDGSVAFFTNSRPLTDDAPVSGNSSLYRWDASRQDGQALTLLTSQDPEPGVLGPAAINDDATSVAFVATGVLAPGAESGKPNLYLWRDEEMRHIAVLDSEGGFGAITGTDSMMWRLDWLRTGGRAARVSADGARLLFASYAEDLDPDGYDVTEDHAEACGDPDIADDRCRQIYLYDARTDRTECLTCVAGVPVSDDANLFGNSDPRRPNAERTLDAPLSLPRNLSADGTRAFFETARPLVSSGLNNAVDVYEWEDRDLDGEGELRLVSAGRGASDSLFLGASASGNDVFFTTRDRLVGIDVDHQVDVYDARVGGGIPAQNPPAPPPPCEGEACQGAPAGAPVLPGVGSGGASHGDPRLRPRPSFSVARLSGAQRARLAAGRRVMLRVRVNRAGRVSLSARAKLGGRMRAVAKASRAARRAGRVGLALKLSPLARGVLARRGELSVRLVVRFSGVREARTSTLRLARAARPSRRGGR